MNQDNLVIKLIIMILIAQKNQIKTIEFNRKELILIISMISIQKIMIIKISDLESTKIINILEKEVILQD